MSGVSISDAQREALKDLAIGPLVRTVAGWGREGRVRWHAAGTVDALERKGLCTIAARKKLWPGVRGTATITPDGAREAGRCAR